MKLQHTLVVGLLLAATYLQAETIANTDGDANPIRTASAAVPLPKPKPKKVCRAIAAGGASIYGLNNGSGDGSRQILADGGRLNINKMTAAMLYQPLHTWVCVTRKTKSGERTIKVWVNDRGPYVRGRVIDLTPAASRALGFSDGVVSVVVRPCTC